MGRGVSSFETRFAAATVAGSIMTGEGWLLARGLLANQETLGLKVNRAQAGSRGVINLRKCLQLGAT